MQEIRRAGYILALVIGVALTTAFVWHPAPPQRFTGMSNIPIPAMLDGYRGQNVPVDDATKAALNSAEIISRKYTDDSGREVDFTMIGGTDRSALHDPRSCLVGAGWKIQNDKVELLQVSSTGSVPARTCTATMAESGDSSGYDILYLYCAHRKVIASATEIRLALLESALLEQNDEPVYFLRFMTPLAGTQNPDMDHQALTAFAADFWKDVSPSILRGES